MRRRSASDRRLERVPRVTWRAAAPFATSSLFIGALLAAATWSNSPGGFVAQAGLDSSWQAALAMTAHRGLDFGTQIVWTYGPLGFLTLRPMYYPGPTLLALVFQFAMASAIMAVLVHALRRHASLAVAVAVAYLAGYPLVAMTPGADAVLALSFVLCVCLLSRSNDAWSARWYWAGFGATAGLMVLIKVSLGVGVLVLAAIAATCAPVRRRLIAAGCTIGSFIVVFAVGWFATGNGVGNIVAYVRAARAASLGYTAMALDPIGQPHDLLLALIASVAIVVAASLHARGLLRPIEPEGSAFEPGNSRRTAAGVIAASAFVMWLLFKEGFVRQDGHRIVFFAVLPVIASAFLIARRSTTPASDGVPSANARTTRAIAVAVLVGAAVAAFAVAGIVPAALIDPSQSISALKSSLQTLASPTRRHTVLAGARATLQQQYAIPAPMLRQTAGQTVDIDPIEQSVAWAYPSMRWDPLPTLQDYFAYTPGLDKLDADDLASSKAPRFILRQIPTTIDARVPVFDAPATQIAIECRYRQVAVSPAWQLVERGPNRCGPMRKVGQEHAGLGRQIDVPQARAGSMVVATFDLHLPFWWHPLDTLYKAPAIYVDVNGDTNIFATGHPNRFVTATASELHLLAPATTLGYLPAFSPPPIRTLALMSSKGAGWKYTVTFYEVPLR